MTAATAQRAESTGRRPQSGPPLLVPVLAYAALTVAAVVTSRSTPHPDASGLDVLRYAQAHHGAIKLGSFLLMGSAVPLALAAAVIYRRLRALGLLAVSGERGHHAQAQRLLDLLMDGLKPQYVPVARAMSGGTAKAVGEQGAR